MRGSKLLEDQVKSLADLAMNLNSEEKCIDLLVKIRWGGELLCPNKDCTNNEKFYFLKKRMVFKCSCCRKQFSIRQGTIFENSNISLVKWFMAIFFFTTDKGGISSIQLSKHIGVQQKTAWLMLHKLRESVKDENCTILNGIVEVDEAYCGARRARDKRLAAKIHEQNELRIAMNAEGKNEKASRIRKERRRFEEKGIPIPKRPNKFDEHKSTLPFCQRLLFEEKHLRMLQYQPIHYAKNIFGIIERDIVGYNVYGQERIFKRGRIVLVKLGRQQGEITQKNVMKLLKKHVDQNAIVMTDEHVAYNKVSNHFKNHFTVQHSLEKEKLKAEKIEYAENGQPIKKGVEYVIEDAETGIEVTTNRIENVWKHFKRMENGTYIQFSWKYTDRYLNEFSYRWNNRDLSPAQLFIDLLGKSMGNSISRKQLFSTKDDYKFIAA